MPAEVLARLLRERRLEHAEPDGATSTVGATVPATMIGLTTPRDRATSEPGGNQMSASESPSGSGEPVLAWLDRRTSLARQREVEFDDARLEYRRLFSEVWGTFLLVLVAAGGGVVGATAFGTDLTLAMKALAPGMMVMGIIFFMGTISGAHLNPAVTLAFAVRGNFPWRRVPGYIVAQVVGAVLAAWFLQLMYGGIINGATEPTADVSLGVAMLTEAVLTLGLVSVILGTASGARNVGINGAIAVGAYIGLVSVWGAPVSGASMNPARSFGPGADRRGPDRLLDLSGRADHRGDARRRLRVHPQGQGHQGRRRSRPGHPRREPPGTLTGAGRPRGAPRRPTSLGARLRARRYPASSSSASMTAMAKPSASVMLMAADITRAVPMIGATATSTFWTSSRVTPASTDGPMCARYDTGRASTAASAASRISRWVSAGRSHWSSEAAVIIATVSSTGVSLGTT